MENELKKIHCHYCNVEKKDILLPTGEIYTPDWPINERVKNHTCPRCYFKVENQMQELINRCLS